MQLEYKVELNLHSFFFFYKESITEQSFELLQINQSYAESYCITYTILLTQQSTLNDLWGLAPESPMSRFGKIDCRRVLLNVFNLCKDKR